MARLTLNIERVIPVPAQRLESGTKAAARNPAVVLAARRRSTIRGVWRRFRSNNGGRLNVIDGRLALIEKHAGMGEGVSALKSRYSAAIEVAITRARASRDLRTVKASDGADVYAYPHRDGIAWGANCPAAASTFFVE